MDNATLRLILFMLLFIVGGGIYSIAVSYFTRNAIVRYLPSIVGIAAIPYLLYRIYYGNLEGFLPLAYFIFIFMIVAVIIGNTAANVIIGIRRRRKNK